MGQTVLNEYKSLPEEVRHMAVWKARKRYIGHVKFVGQLYQVSLLNDKTMHYMLGRLLSARDGIDGVDEDSVQCFCTLMMVVENKLRTSAAKEPEHGELMKSHFKALVALSENKALSNPVRCMCKDLLEGRAKAGNFFVLID